MFDYIGVLLFILGCAIILVLTCMTLAPIAAYLMAQKAKYREPDKTEKLLEVAKLLQDDNAKVTIREDEE